MHILCMYSEPWDEQLKWWRKGGSLSQVFYVCAGLHEEAGTQEGGLPETH